MTLPEKYGDTWSEADIVALLHYAREGRTLVEVARLLHRTPAAVVAKLRPIVEARLEWKELVKILRETEANT